MSRPRLVIVTGTGTEIGKTRISVGLLAAWGAAGVPVIGLKPVESGVPKGTLGADADALERASSFHVKHSPPYMLERPVSPHLAARADGERISLPHIEAWLAPIRDAAGLRGIILELPGGLFSPLTETEANVDLALALRGNVVLLVAPDRLGVLHDIGATVRAAHASGLTVDGLVLNAPPVPDASTGTNAAELHTVSAVPLVATIPRDPAPADFGPLLTFVSRGPAA